MGKGTLLAKMDVSQAFRNIPDDPPDGPLLGMEWEGRVHADKCSPLGCDLPHYYLADALTWKMRQQGVSWVYQYIDNLVRGDGVGKLRRMP